MSQSSFLSIVATFLSSSFAFAFDFSASVREAVPNIVILLADDLGWKDVGWHGSEIPTPNLDRLANAGAQLDYFYVQPVCSPTRAALMTGRYPIRHGLQVGVIRPWAMHGLPLQEQTLAQGLKDAGYATAIVGKWHLGHFREEYLPTRRGFDHQYGHYNGAIDYFDHTRDGGFDWHRDDQVCRDKGYSTHLLADEAVRIVQQHAGRKPFFLYVPFNAVHSPHQVPRKYLEGFDHLKGDRRSYAGMLTAMDEAIGRIIDAIDEAGERSNTLFFFSSDNGGPAPGKVTSNGDLRAAKGTVYEGGVRVPALMAWEGKIPAGAIVKTPMHIVDLYPTLLGVAHAKVDQHLPLDGLDMWEAISKDQAMPDREILINAAPRSGALRSGGWKLVVHEGKSSANGEVDDEVSGQENTLSRIELFDLEKDPNETTNLAHVHPQRVRAMLQRWKEYRSEAIAPRSEAKPQGFVVPEIWGQ